MNELTLEALNNAIQLLKENPLLKRGIKPDWVCVLHPQMERLLLQEFPDQPLERLTGRRTYMIEAAPVDRMEYMTYEMMVTRYPAWFPGEKHEL